MLVGKRRAEARDELGSWARFVFEGVGSRVPPGLVLGLLAALLCGLVGLVLR